MPIDFGSYGSIGKYPLTKDEQLRSGSRPENVIEYVSESPPIIKDFIFDVQELKMNHIYLDGLKDIEELKYLGDEISIFRMILTDIFKVDPENKRLLTDNREKLKQFIFEEQKKIGPLLNIPTNILNDVTVITDGEYIFGKDPRLIFEGILVTEETLKKILWTDSEKNFLNEGDETRYSPLLSKGGKPQKLLHKIIKGKIVPCSCDNKCKNADKLAKTPGTIDKPITIYWHDRMFNAIRNYELEIDKIVQDIHNVKKNILSDDQLSNTEKIELLDRVLDEKYSLAHIEEPLSISELQSLSEISKLNFLSIERDIEQQKNLLRYEEKEQIDGGVCDNGDPYCISLGNKDEEKFRISPGSELLQLPSKSIPITRQEALEEMRRNPPVPPRVFAQALNPPPGYFKVEPSAPTPSPGGLLLSSFADASQEQLQELPTGGKPRRKKRRTKKKTNKRKKKSKTSKKRRNKK